MVQTVSVVDLSAEDLGVAWSCKNGLAVFIPGIFLFEGTPLIKAYNPPTAACQIVCSRLNLFFCRDNELQICHGNFLLMDNKHKKLFVIKQSKGCKYMSKMHQNTFGGRELMRSPGSPSQNGGLLLRGRR